ncbi:MAG: mechanosensitive ion channel [Gammaproteobacteria bacterium]|jgi:small-conductance mechanosensitive channel
MDNQTLHSIAAFGDLLDLGKISMLVMAAIFLWLVNRLLRHLAQTLMEKIPSRRFMILQFATLLTFVWYIGGFYMMVAGILQPPKEMLLAIGGSAAVAIGIALKDVAASIIAGVILLFDRPFQVGDRVSFGDTYGEIVSIGLRSVRLNTLDDNLVTIPNARFITEVVASGNAGALDMMVVCDFHVALDADLATAQNLVYEAIVTSRFAYLKKPVSFAINEVVVANRLAIQIRAKAYVLDVHYEKAFQSDVVTRVSRLFIENGIQRPVFQSQITIPIAQTNGLTAPQPCATLNQSD